MKMLNKDWYEAPEGGEFVGFVDDHMDFEIISHGEHLPTVKEKKGQLYAMLWNAERDEQYSHEIEFVYSMLLNKGVPEKNIMLMVGKGEEQLFRDRRPEFCAETGHIEPALETLINNGMSEDDRFLWFSTNHGKTMYGQSYFWDRNDMAIFEDTFASFFEDVPMNYGVFCFAHCYSGGLAETIGKKNRIGISSTTRHSVAYCVPKHRFSFMTLVMPQLLSDMSIADAFEISAKSDMFEEMPQLFFENADPDELCLIKK